ncbi:MULTISPECIES: PH domain-containing protein [Alkalimonas]|uniref:PH domain-containing protein n=1 Tax=Alkalimonas mucilaginosa TaxID=3057676 RepID=A0ABU7JLQ9_9GAMM|nr:PH domain-containing protein [Alkalimonas sp. MEB004]MEE2025898.1 PH domain-containing protein [Alkalimonas sp. MEB004]
MASSSSDATPFQNAPLPPSLLPELQQLTWQPLSPRYNRLAFWLNSCVTFLLVLLSLTYWLQPFWQPDESNHKLLLGFAGLLVAASLWKTLYCLLAYPRKRYALREHDISFHSGLLFEKSVTQPILRIQHIELKRGPIERRAGLATLQVFSAGGAMHTFEIPGLPLIEAKKIRQFILQHKDNRQHD